MPLFTGIAIGVGKLGIIAFKKLVLVKLGKLVLNEALGQIITSLAEKGLLQAARGGNRFAQHELVEWYQAEIETVYDGDIIQWVFEKTSGDYLETVEIIGLALGIDFS